MPFILQSFMAHILYKLRKFLPLDQSQQSNQKRVTIWQRWDTNMLDFINLKDVEEELSRLLGLNPTPNFSLVVKKSFRALKDSQNVSAAFEKEYLEKRFFRLFLENFSRFFEKMLIFEQIDSNKDNRISYDELISIEKILQKWKLDNQKYVRIYQMSTRNELDFDSFISWMSGLEQCTIDDLL